MSHKKIILKRKTPYNFVHVIQSGSCIELWFKGEKDFFLQSRIDTSDRHNMAMTYSQLMMGAFLFQPAPKRVLIIGLGGGLIPNHIRYNFPETQIDVVEIDPVVIELAKKYFFFEETVGCRAYAEDGRLFIQDRLGKVFYDIVFLDAFKSGSVPFHLKTQEFYEEIRQVLTPDGVLGSNLYGKSNDLKPHDLKTVTRVFSQTYLFEDPDRIATVLLATRQSRLWRREEMKGVAKELMDRRPMPLSMDIIVDTYQPNALKDKVAFVFKDKLSNIPFKESVKKNNLDLPDQRPYSIQNTNRES